MSENTQNLTGQELIGKIIAFGLETVLQDKELTLDEEVKEDVLAELTGTILNESSVQFAENAIANIEPLAESFKAIPRGKRLVISYLFDQLDLPRITAEVAGIEDLLKALTRAYEASGRSTVSPQGGFNIDNLSNNGIIFTGEGDDARTIAFIRVTEQNVIVFEVTRTDATAYHTVVADGNLVISKLNEYTIDNFLSDLNNIDNIEYRPKLISERETVSVGEITVEDLDAELQANPTLYQNNRGPKLLVDNVIAQKATELGLDLSDKRVDLANIDELFKHAFNAVTALMQPNEVVADEEPAVEATQETQVPTTMPPTVVTETSNSNPAIANEDLFGEDKPVVTFEENIVKALKAVSENIPGLNMAIEGNKDNIKETVTNYVIGFLAPIEQRGVNTFTPFEIETIKHEVGKELPNLLKSVDAYKDQMAKEDEEKRLYYTTALVNETIDESRLHSSFISRLGVNRALLVSSLTDYLNDNKREVGSTVTSQKLTINAILDNIGMYEYNLEVLGNDEFRNLNAPTSNIISSTKLLQRAVVLNYEMVEEVTDKALITDGLASIKSGINLDSQVVRAIMANLKPMQMFKLEAPNNTYVLRGEDKTVPVNKDDENGAELNVVSKLIIMRADNANILHINNDGENYDVRAAITINDNSQRIQLLHALTKA